MLASLNPPVGDSPVPWWGSDPTLSHQPIRRMVGFIGRRGPRALVQFRDLPTAKPLYLYDLRAVVLPEQQQPVPLLSLLSATERVTLARPKRAFDDEDIPDDDLDFEEDLEEEEDDLDFDSDEDEDSNDFDEDEDDFDDDEEAL